MWPNPASISALTFDSTGRLLAAGDRDGRIRIWSVAASDVVTAFDPLGDSVLSLAFTRDDTVLFVFAGREMVGFHVETGMVLSRGEVPGARALAISPDASRVVSWVALSMGRHVIDVVDLPSMRERQFALSEKADSTAIIYDFAVNPDYSRLAVGGVLGGLKVWDLTTDALLFDLTPEGAVHSVAYSLDGRLIAAEGYSLDGADGELIDPEDHSEVLWIWDAETGEALRTINLGQDGRSGGMSMTFLEPQSDRLALRFYDNLVQVWDVSTGRLEHRIDGHILRDWMIQFSPDGSRLAVGESLGALRLHDPVNGDVLREWPETAATLMHVEFDAEAPQLTASYYDGTVRTWDMVTGELLAEVPAPLAEGQETANELAPDPVTSLDGSRVAVPDLMSVTVREVATGESVFEASTGLYQVGSVALSQDGGLLAVCDSAGTVSVYRLDEPDAVVKVRPGALLNLETFFSPDQSQFATLGPDSILKIWDLATSDLLAEKRLIEGSPTGAFSGADVDISPDWMRVAILRDGIIRTWAVQPE